MSVADQGSPAPSLRRLPFTVRLSPQLLNQLLLQRNRSDSPGEISGLLFGLLDGGLVIGQAFRKFDGATGSGSAERLSQDKLIEQQLTLAQKNPETASLDLIGWYAIRDSGGLSASDLTYHDWFFPRPTDLALIIKAEGSSGVSLEVYCRTITGLMSEEGHRVGLVRLSNSPLESPVEVVPRPKIQDDFFMRAYEIGDAPEEKARGWKGTLAVRYRKAFSFFRAPEDGPARHNAGTLLGDAVPGTAKPDEQRPTPLAETIPPYEPATGQRLASVSPPAAIQKTVQSATKPVPAEMALAPPAPARPSEPAPASYSLNTAPPTAVAHTLATAAPSSPGTYAFKDPSRPKSIWPNILVVFVLTSGLTFGVVYFLQVSGRLPRIMQLFSSQTTLGLKVESQGDRLLVTWNKQHPLVEHARTGLLQIDDGEQRRQVTIDAPHVAYGSILYRPLSDDVTFRLEVHGANGEQAIESIRVLDSSKSSSSQLEPLDLSPQTPPNSPVTTKQQPGLVSRPGESGTPPNSVFGNSHIGSARGVPAAGPKTSALAKGIKDSQYRARELTNSPAEEVQATPEEPAAKSLTPAAQISLPLAPTSEPAVRIPQTPAPAHTTAVPSSLPESQPTAPALDGTNNPGTTPLSYQPPRPTRQVLPNVSLLPSGVLARTSQLEVLVKVDEQGRVTEVRPVEDGKRINQALLGSAILAARQWRFEPATMRGKPVASQHSIVFQFAPRTQ